MDADVHLVGDVSEVAATAGGTAIVHLERGDDAVLVDLDRLGVLTADIEDGSGFGEHGMCPQTVTENLRANALLREG